MGYDQELADRVRAHVEHERGLTERRMFGGLAFMINGRMAVAAGSNGGLMLRVDPADTERLLQEPPASPFEMRGRDTGRTGGAGAQFGATGQVSGFKETRPVKGWINLDANAIGADEELARWIGLGVAYAKSLPPK